MHLLAIAYREKNVLDINQYLPISTLCRKKFFLLSEQNDYPLVVTRNEQI